MSETKPILYVFAISHYCEKARWALDYLGIDYELRYAAPGEHGKIANELGAPRSSVPFLHVGDQVIQGSAEITDWAENTSTSDSRRLTPDDEHDTCLQIEKRIDEVAGVHVRRFYYSEAIVDYPGTVRPMFTRDLPLKKKLLTSIFWGKICKIMIERMDLGPRQAQESKHITEGELDWVDELLAGGRRYLVGEEFSRADIAVASLLAPLAKPPEHPTYGKIVHPPYVASIVAGWEHRPSIAWVRDIYARHR